jgi:hypothetical protein
MRFPPPCWPKFIIGVAAVLVFMAVLIAVPVSSVARLSSQNAELRAELVQQNATLHYIECLKGVEAELWSGFSDVLRYPSVSPEREEIIARLDESSDRLADPDYCR